MLDRTHAPAFQIVDHIDMLKATEKRLKNNIPVYYINAGTADVVKIDFIFEAGTYYQPSALTASTANSLLTEGTTNYTSAQIAEKLDFFGSSVRLDVDKHTATVTVLSLRKHLPQTLEIVEDILKNANFPEHELQTYLMKRRQQFTVEMSKVEVLSHRRFTEVLFGEKHPYSRNVQLVDFEQEDLRANILTFYRNFYNSRNCKIIASGKISDDEIHLLENYFGGNDWIKDYRIFKPSYLFESSKTAKHFVAKDDAVQSAIRIGKPLINKLHDDFHGLQVLNTIFGGYFGSRLMSNLREDKGFTYGISSAAVSLKDTGFFIIATNVASEVCDDALQEIYFEAEELCRKAVPDEELRLVKNYLTGELQRMFDGAFALASSFKSILDFDLDYTYYDKLISTVKNITPNELKDLANKYLQPESFYEVVAGKPN